MLLYKVRCTDSAVMCISCHHLYNYGHSLLMNSCESNAFMASVHPLFDYNDHNALSSFQYYSKHEAG